VIPLHEFRRYYDEGGAQLWERQALTRARVVFGDAGLDQEVMAAVDSAAFGLPWRPELAVEIAAMRERVEASSGRRRDLKRGFGGIIDVEFLVQLFRLKYGRDMQPLRSPNTWQALDALCTVKLIDQTQHQILRSGYDFLRLVESRLRIVHNRSLDELPERPEDLEKLARRLGCEATPGTSAGRHFLELLDRHTRDIREVFLNLVHRERGSAPH
jgi:glutamate-ammonia-ligase adenylyltransferase